MNIHGSRTLDAPRDAVFDAICDPDVLLAVIPGCQRDRAGRRRVPRADRPAPPGRRRDVPDRRPPRRDRPARLRAARGRGRRARSGRSAGEATFRLAEADGGTTVDYEGQAELGGPLARLDCRFVEGLAGSLVGQGLGEPRGASSGRTPARRRRPTVRAADGRRRRDGRGYYLPRVAARGARPRSTGTGPELLVMAGGTVAMPLINEGISLPEAGDGPAPGGPRRGSTEPTASLRIGATTTLTPARGPGRRPDAPRGGPQHGQLVGPQHGAPSAGTSSRRRPAATSRSRCWRSMRRVTLAERRAASASSRSPTSSPGS